MTAQEYFDRVAYPWIRDAEGDYNPNDPSMHGILQTTYDAWRARQGLGPRDVRYITDQETYAIYLTQYWRAGGGEALAEQQQFPLSLVHFDAGVNHGTGAARELLTDSGHDVPTYLRLRQERYEALATTNPAKHQANLPGWLERLRDLQARLTMAGGTVGLSLVALIVGGAFLLRRGH